MKIENLQVVCLVMIDEDGFIFAAQRPPGKKLHLHWEFPGGKIESGEHPEAALRREILEELSLTLGPLEKLRGTTHDYDFARIHLIPYLHRCKKRPAVKLSEHIDSCWIIPSDLPAFTWAPADIPLVKNLFVGPWPHE